MLIRLATGMLVGVNPALLVIATATGGLPQLCNSAVGLSVVILLSLVIG